ncbi:excalibur calcium-binding domain-containing protein [Nocardia sp. CA-129566]
MSGRPPGEQRASGGFSFDHASHLDRDNDGIACE